MKPTIRNKALKFSYLVTLCIGISGCAHIWTTSEDSEKAQSFLSVATEQLNQREYNKALESCQLALKHDPNLAAAYNHMALVYMETKRFQKAEEAFKRALELKEDYSEVFNNYGVLLNRQERYSEAIPWFEKALQDEKFSTPENALTNLGLSYFKMGNHSKAKAFHQKALDVMPQFCLANKNLGDIYSKEKNFGKAADAFERAVTNCPLFQEAQYKLGLALMKTGSRAVARAQLEKLIRVHKQGPYVDRSHEVLKYLQ